MPLTNFTFSNLLGTVYKQGNICFSSDGKYLISPVGNRISVFDLINNRSFTFPFEARKNIINISISPNNKYMIAIDEDGKALFINMLHRCVIHRIGFKSRVLAIEFSPCGKYFAVALKHKNLLQIWKTPLLNVSDDDRTFIGVDDEKYDDFIYDFSPFTLKGTFSGHHDYITSISWSSDSRYILTGSRDLSMRIITRVAEEGFIPLNLSGHRDGIISCFWMDKDQTGLVSVSKDGALFIWKRKADVDFGFKLEQKHYFNVKNGSQAAKVCSASYHQQSDLLVVGFSHGVFGVWEVADFNCLHTLSLSQHRVDSLAISPSGEWFAFASSHLGQLMVWEWQSETYILKQQGHLYDMSCLAYSQDGDTVVTGGDDGKLKVWDISSGFCYLTFSEHSASITGVEFAGKKDGKQGVVFSSSLDGTVRAFDLLRCRNFRTFTAPYPTQFSCLAVDPEGEIICAGSMDTFEIFVWSVQTGNLLDVLAGHEGPISCLSFSPDGAYTEGGSDMNSSLLASGSWDKTVRIWNLFSRGDGSKCTEVFHHQHDVISLAFRPDGKEICVSTLDGKLQFWNPVSGGLSPRIREIEGRHDIKGGRLSTSRTTAQNMSSTARFVSVAYSTDGNQILACGNSKQVCLYDLNSGVLLKKFATTHNMSLDGLREKLNSKNMTEFGPVDMFDDDDDSDSERKALEINSLPGATKGQMAKPNRPMVRNRAVRFSPTGGNWTVISTQGILVYSLDSLVNFDPLDLDVDITPEEIRKELLKAKKTRNYLKPLVMALRLGENSLTQLVYEGIPLYNAELAIRELPSVYVGPLLKMISSLLTGEDAFTKPSRHIEFNLLMISFLVKYHGKFIRETKKMGFATNNQNSDLKALMRSIRKSLHDYRSDLLKLCEESLQVVRFTLASANKE